jgi:hypothetical protein
LIEKAEDHVTVALHIIDYLSSDDNKSQSTPFIPPASSSFTPDQFNMAATVTSGIEEIPITFWQEVKDPKTNHVYYWNTVTNETSWTLPPNAVLTSEAAERSDEIQDPENEGTSSNQLLANTHDMSQVNSADISNDVEKKKKSDKVNKECYQRKQSVYYFIDI